MGHRAKRKKPTCTSLSHFFSTAADPHTLPPSLFPPHSIDFKIKKVLLDGAWAKLQVWDTAGQERFRTITAAYYRGAGGVLLVYDVSDASSFASVRNWLRGIEQHAADGVVKVRDEGKTRGKKEQKRSVGRRLKAAGLPLSFPVATPPKRPALERR
jgi:GTPase SAR1 family protein